VQPNAEAVEKFNKRIKGMQVSKTMSNLDKFREMYSADPLMTDSMKAQLEAQYWKKRGEIEGAESEPPVE
jgi:hypothetical protein